MTEDELPDWDRIVEQDAKRVFRVALRILRSVHDAEDVAQDVFTEALRLHRKGPVQSWTGLLVRLATLWSLDRLRRHRPSVDLRDDDRVSTVGPVEEAGARELADWLGKAIARLPEQQATVFVMHHFEQLSARKSRQLWAFLPTPSRRRCTRRGNGCSPSWPFRIGEIAHERRIPCCRFREPGAPAGSRGEGGLGRADS